MYSRHAQAEPVCIWDKIHVTLFCSVLNSEGCPLIYKMQEWMNISISLHLPEKGSGDTIFGSLEEDWVGGVCGSGMCEDENRDGVGSG